jgi:hypothetical protein
MNRHAVLLAVVGLAGCAASPSSLAPNQALTLKTSASLTTGAHDVTAPDSAKRGIYVSVTGAAPGILGYPSNNKSNGPPTCSENTQAYNVAVDRGGNVIVSGDSGVTVFRGPSMCGQQLGSFQTRFGDPAVDATSPDAANGTIAVGIVQEDGSGVGGIELCTLKSGCTGNLVSGQINEVLAVAMSAKGCWASSADPTALTYFKTCSGSGQTATGYENQSAGGLDIDPHGNIVSLSQTSAQVYVYSGCNPACKVIGGPFSLRGQAVYGHLNKDGSRLAIADYQAGSIDVYEYTPRKITYLYSFDNGISPSQSRLGVAYNPRSKE